MAWFGAVVDKGAWPVCMLTFFMFIAHMVHKERLKGLVFFDQSTAVVKCCMDVNQFRIRVALARLMFHVSSNANY